MFTILEIQTSNGITSCLTPQYKPTKDQAMSVYHGILQYAAISDVDYHAVIVVDEEGRYLARECYVHTDEEGVNNA